MNRPLTKQQQSVYDFIRDKIVSRGYGPTVREIGEHMNIKSPNGVMCHLRALERKGVLTRMANKSRAIELTESVTQMVGANLPVEGRVAGGNWLISSAGGERLDFVPLTTPEGRCCFRVVDDSLIDGHIQSGDWIVIQKQTQATSGQLALVRLGGEARLLRYWYPERGRVRLQPVARHDTATWVEQAEIAGVVVGVLRMFDQPDYL